MADVGSRYTTTLARSQFTARFVLRGELTAARALSAVFGVALPEKINSANADAARAALMLGPDEWLLLASDAGADVLATALGQALAGIAAALVDVTHRQTGVDLAGEAVTTTLNAAVPLDLSARAFPVGMATRTIFDKSEIVLWRTGPLAFHIEVWRSFAPYVEGLLAVFQGEPLG